MVRKGTPGHVEPAGSFADDRATGSEAAGSAAASTAPGEAEAAGSAAAKRPWGREGRGRAGKYVNKKLEKKSYYEAQGLYRNYWGVRETRRVPFEEASDEYFEELLDHYNWHFLWDATSRKPLKKKRFQWRSKLKLKILWALALPRRLLLR